MSGFPDLRDSLLCKRFRHIEVANSKGVPFRVSDRGTPEIVEPGLYREFSDCG